MMVNVRFEALARAGRNLRAVGLALALNFLWAPLFGWLLASVFISDPLLALGFMLVMVVPCSSMAIGYTGLAKGDLEVATVVVALSFVLAVVAVPAWMLVFAGSYQVPVPIGDLVGSILSVLIAPMILGYVTRAALVRRLGSQGFARLQPLFPALSLLAMYAIVFLIFFGKATLIVDRWTTVLLLLVPNAIFIGTTLLLVTFVAGRLGMGYGEGMAVAFTSTGKNNGTAIAIASTAFSPLVAIPAATMPIFQILLMVLYLRAAPRLRAWFDRRATPASPISDPRVEALE
jgi:arsenite transporter